MPCVNRDNTPESGWIHLNVSIQCVLFLVGMVKKHLRIQLENICSFMNKIYQFKEKV